MFPFSFSPPALIAYPPPGAPAVLVIRPPVLAPPFMPPVLPAMPKNPLRSLPKPGTLHSFGVTPQVAPGIHRIVGRGF